MLGDELILLSKQMICKPHCMHSRSARRNLNFASATLFASATVVVIVGVRAKKDILRPNLKAVRFLFVSFEPSFMIIIIHMRFLSYSTACTVPTLPLVNLAQRSSVIVWSPQHQPDFLNYQEKGTRIQSMLSTKTWKQIASEMHFMLITNSIELNWNEWKYVPYVPYVEIYKARFKNYPKKKFKIKVLW